MPVRALHAAEEPALRFRLAQAAGDEGDEGRAGTRPTLVQIARERFATGAGLADEQYRGGVTGDLLQLGAQLLHQLALARRHRQRRHQQLARLAAAPAGIERTLHRAQQLRERERLFHEIERAEARRLDGGLNRTVTGHHDDGTTIRD